MTQRLQPVSSEVMEALSEKDNPQGILAVVQQKHAALAELSSVETGVAMVTPQDPGNVGTVLRTADAVGTDALFLLDGGVDPYHPTCVRASMGTLFWIPVLQSSFADFVAWAHEHRVQLIGTSAHADADYRNFAPSPPWILVLGSEQKGLSADQLEACDARLVPAHARAREQSEPCRGRRHIAISVQRLNSPAIPNPPCSLRCDNKKPSRNGEGFLIHGVMARPTSDLVFVLIPGFFFLVLRFFIIPFIQLFFFPIVFRGFFIWRIGRAACIGIKLDRCG